MPVKRPQLVNGEIYHIVMRGVDGRIIFPQEEDYLHFLHDLYEFNDEDVVISEFRHAIKNSTGTLPGELVLSRRENKKRKLLVEIFVFCLMPNHFHLLLRQVKDNGISNFMRKLGGYATYINKKYNRQGHLYQGRFKAVHIESEDQLKNVFVYIHTNPLSLIEPNWKDGGINNPQKALEFLKKYRWSSYLDYLGYKNYPSLTNRDFLTDVFKDKESCYNNVKDWILYKKDINELGLVALE